MFDASKHPAPPQALRPSEYTAALIQALRLDAPRVRGVSALEIGSGSGVVLAALGAMGAASLCGVDIEGDAVAAGELLLGDLGHGERACLHRGDMWQPVTGRRFDLIVANLPHFPMEHREVGGRLRTWSSGGPDGRELLDPFLEGISGHFAPGARAILTHNAFVDVACSREIVTRHGLGLRIVMTVLVHIPAEKLALMTPALLCTQEGRSIFRYGPYAFAEMHIVEIAAGNSA
jgi:release factor glutamine methyltransferase